MQAKDAQTRPLLLEGGCGLECCSADALGRAATDDKDTNVACRVTKQ